jgi:hypothetical protein
MTKSNNIDEKIAKLCKKSQIQIVYESVDRVIVLGDIHGDYELAIKMLILADVIEPNTPLTAKLIDATHCKCPKWKKREGKTTYLVQVGDQIDSCRASPNKPCKTFTDTLFDDKPHDVIILNMFTDLNKQAIKCGDRVISLLGNHELLNAQGNFTYVSATNQTDLEYRANMMMPNSNMNVDEHIGCTRIPSVIIGNNLFVHAGLINSIMSDLKIDNRKDFVTINEVVIKWLLNQKVDESQLDKIINTSPHHESMFWTRLLGELGKNGNDYEKCSKNISDVVKFLGINNIIVGHTPQSFINGVESNKFECDNMNIWRIDNGSASGFNIFDNKMLNDPKHKLDNEYIPQVDTKRLPQVLEIINGTQFRVIKLDPNTYVGGSHIMFRTV